MSMLPATIRIIDAGVFAPYLNGVVGCIVKCTVERDWEGRVIMYYVKAEDLNDLGCETARGADYPFYASEVEVIAE